MTTEAVAELSWRNVREREDFPWRIPEPVSVGPTWAENPDWDGVNPGERYKLPRWTLGWQAAAWVHENLLNDEGDPFRLTAEQLRFLLWWYAVDGHGRFVYRQGILQRLKGWGKDPFGAVLMAIEFIGPCRFAGWARVDMPDRNLLRGDPVAKENGLAWVQAVAVSLSQTQNTMAIFQSLFSKECIERYDISVGKEIIYAQGGKRKIQAVTSSPSTLEGNRPSFVVANEGHHWLESNKGHELGKVLRRNLAKAKGGSSRMLHITNAFQPGQDSVIEHRRKTYDAAIERGMTPEDLGVLYDSLEMPEGTHLALPDVETPEGKREATVEEVQAYIGAVIDAVRGDASWYPVDRIVGEILDGETTVQESRRFYYNQVVEDDDVWVLSKAVDLAFDEDVKEHVAKAGGSRYHDRWTTSPTEPVVLFFDGSKSRDATGVVGCRLSDGHVFTVGVWQKPRGNRGSKWTVPRGKVDERVREAFARFNVVGFWADPSHAQDDEDGTYFWDEIIDGWHRDFGQKLRKELWSVKSAERKHSIMWDMTSPQRSELFVQAAQRFVDEMEMRNDIEELAPSFTHDGHPALVSHLKNSRMRMTKWGQSLGKPNRDSTKKVDLAVCAVGARMLRRVALNAQEEEEPKPGGFWSY